MANEIGVTEVTNVSQALIASLVQDVLKQKSILMPTVDDYSRFAVKGAKSVGVPRRTQFTQANKAENTDLTAQEMTFASDVIALDKHKAIYSKLEKIAGVQASPDVVAEIVKESAAELSLQLDKDIIAELRKVSTTSPDHEIKYLDTSFNVLAKGDILEARALLNKAVVPLDNRYLVISPDKEKQMLAISDFVKANEYGSTTAIQKGELGKIYGFTVLMHTALADDEILAYHKSHVGMAIQLAPEFRTNFQLRSVSDEYLLHWIYGVKVMGGATGVRGVQITNTTPPAPPPGP
jgi:N4-gp56 family major capsid protein